MRPLKRLEKANTIDNLWLYIIHVLIRKPQHAYILHEEIQKQFNFKVGKITTYKVLYRLKMQGYVEPEKGKRKTIYKVTENGKKALKEAIISYKKQIKRLD
jgi:DNA-binding PadR family transcriptional regulator